MKLFNLDSHVKIVHEKMFLLNLQANIWTKSKYGITFTNKTLFTKISLEDFESNPKFMETFQLLGASVSLFKQSFNKKRASNY